MGIMNFDKELTALQTWLMATTGIPSWKLKETPTKLPRPVVIWEPAFRGAKKNATLYEYVIPVQQYGHLYVTSVEQAIDYQDKLIKSLADSYDRINVVENNEILQKLRNIELTFEGDGSLDIPFTLKYDISYFRTQPGPAPHATTVTNKIITSNL